MTSIFLDCDGVLANFDHHVMTLFGNHPRKMGGDVLWENVSSIDDFWLKIPVMSDTHSLVKYLQNLPYELTILTGCPKTNSISG